MSGTANSFSMLNLNRKRKYEEGNGEPATECDSDSESDSDMACIAPESDDDSGDPSNTLHVGKHVTFSTSCDAGPSIMHVPFSTSCGTAPSIKQNAIHVVEERVPYSASCDTGASINPNALHVVEERVPFSTSCDTGPSITHVPFSTSCSSGPAIKPNTLHVFEKHVSFVTPCDTGPSTIKKQVCVGGTSSANGSNVSATLPSVTKPALCSWATKYVFPPDEPQNSTTADQTNEKEATKVKKNVVISAGSLKSANTIPSNRAKTVWVFGDSWIHWVRKYAQVRREDINLGIPNLKTYWFPEEEMRWSSLTSAIRNVNGVPDADVVLIHCGAEDLCYLSRYDLTTAMKKDILIIKSMFPVAQVVFSCIPQRKVWVTASALGTSIGRARRNINKFLAEFLGEHGMFHIRHDNIVKDAKLFRDDGVQLSHLGNSNFLQNIRQALKELP